MEGTPRAKARRQSLPSQHHLSPSGTLDESLAHGELLRFRDEMGIYPQLHATNPANSHLNGDYHELGSVLNGHGSLSNILRPPQPQTSSFVALGANNKENESRNAFGKGVSMKIEERDGSLEALSSNSQDHLSSEGANPGGSGSGDGTTKKKARKKWTLEETKMLHDGCNKHGVGNWKSILDDPELHFDPDRTPVDLKDRFRTFFPDVYRHLYPNAKTHLSSSNSSRAKRAELPDTLTIFEKSRSKKRRPFTKDEDAALRKGFEKHGTVWALIAKDPALSSRRSTDLRDRFRNAFPDLYEKAGYKPRPNRPLKKRRGDEIGESSGQGTSSGLDGHLGGSNAGNSNGTYDNRMSLPNISLTPEDDDSIKHQDGSPSTPLMETDSIGTPEQLEDGSRDLNPAMLPIPSSTDTSAVPSRQRSPSNARNFEQTEYYSPRLLQHSPHVQPSQQSHPQLNQLHPALDARHGNNAWYSARWLSGGQGGHGEDPWADGQNHPNHHSQLHPNHHDAGLGLGLNGLSIGLGLTSAGWSDPQEVINRYDLPSSSSQLLHGGEFQSEAAIGDTGSSISGLDEFNANLNLSMSSHHRYAGDLFHGKGAGYGGTGWGGWGQQGFGFMLGGNHGGMPSFARAAIDLGAPGPHNAARTPNVSGVPIGMNVPGLGSATQSPELGQVIRQDHGLDSIDELEAVLGKSLLASPNSVDPAKTLLNDVASPPPGTPAHNSPQRSFTNMDNYGNTRQHPGMGLARHSSMSAGETLSQSRSMGMEGTQAYHHNHHENHQPHAHTGSSHSRSFSQPPSDSRLPVGMGRPANTAVPSPMKGAFSNLDSSGYVQHFDSALGQTGENNSQQIRNFGVEQQNNYNSSGTPNLKSQNLPMQQAQSPHHHPPPLHHGHSHNNSHSLSQQQRTPVQSHAALPRVMAQYPPATSPALFNPPGASWGHISTAAMALDLHGYQMHQNPHSQNQNVTALGLATNNPSCGTNPYGSANQFMDQYLDFETNALDLATANLPTSGTIFSSGQSLAAAAANIHNASQTHNVPQVAHRMHRDSVHNSNPTPPKNVFVQPPNPPQHVQQHTPPFTHHPPQPSLNHPMINSGSMDDSMIIQPTNSMQNHNGGMVRRESFSYGSTAANQAMPGSMMNPLNRVHSAGGALGMPTMSPNNVNMVSQAGETFKSKGWDQTVTAKTSKRSSWGGIRTLASS
ncbi:hypothetical protein CPB86DRAFT_740042 [Serendipita vermifera]|nr:hypothetical protein CPB86DRAFT_740042 [Serendipita vermifera]